MARTSPKTLEVLVNEWINPRLGFHVGQALWRQVDGRSVATVGMTYVYRCLGVWALHRMENENGGVSVILSCTTASEFETALRSFIKGLDYKGSK